VLDAEPVEMGADLVQVRTAVHHHGERVEARDRLRHLSALSQAQGQSAPRGEHHPAQRPVLVAELQVDLEREDLGVPVPAALQVGDRHLHVVHACDGETVHDSPVHIYLMFYQVT
jgi:hypothetical protein